MKKGNKYLKSALIEAAHSVKGSKTYLGALYRWTAARNMDFFSARDFIFMGV